MSGQSAKRRKMGANASAGVSAFDNLPSELLEAIFGLLDVQTLCTARLVCTLFHGVASRGLHSVKLSVKDLRSRPETTLNNFPNLSRVSVFSVKEDDLTMLAQSPIALAVTHVHAAEHLRLVPRRGQIAAGSPLLPLPNLISLTVGYTANRGFPFPQTLRELSLCRDVTPRTAKLVARLTNLTSLQIGVHPMGEPFEALAALTVLQRLEIFCSLSFIPVVVGLTLLTHLHFIKNWVASWRPGEAAPGIREAGPLSLALASLTRLDRLVHLGIGPFCASLELQLLASIGTITSLRSLDLQLGRRPERSAFETVCMTAFSQLTALRLESGIGLDASFLPRFNLETLQDLSTSYRVDLHQGGVAALRRATGLTRLHIWTPTCRSLGVEEFGIALSHMPRLRALSLSSPATVEPFCFQAIGLLSELTRLECLGGHFSDADVVKVCLRLRKLRVLRIEPNLCPAYFECATPELFFAVAKLPELTKFSTQEILWSNRLKLTAEVRAGLDAERHEKGWPSLELDIPGLT